MKRHILEYTDIEDRSTVWEGTFEETDNINIGDYILTHHKCRECLAPIMQKVTDKRIAMYFQGKPLYDYSVVGGGCYKSNLKHVSLYDQRVKECNIKM